MKPWILGTIASIGLVSALTCAAAEEKKPATSTGAGTAVERPARPGGGPGQQGDRLKMISERLGLNADQQAKLKPILEEERKKTQELRQDTNLQPTDRREKMAKIRQDTQKKIKDANILTADQLKKWEEIQNEMRQRGGGGGGGGRGSGQGQGQGQRPNRPPGTQNAPQ